MPYFESGGGNATSGTISGSLGFTIKWIKVGRVVSLQFDNDTTNIPPGASDIATLPDDLTPAISMKASCYRESLTKCAFTTSPTTNKLSVYNDSGSNVYYIGGSMTYISKK